MNDFKNRGFRIANSPLEVRLAYTGFLLFAAIGYLTMTLMGFVRVGPGAAAVVIHYRGSGGEEAFPRAVGQMLEEAHFHAFIEGIVLLVLAHLFVATSINRRMKIAVIGLAYVSTLLDLASPWLVKYVAPGFAYLQIGCWSVMLLTAAALIGVPLYEMWFTKEN
ncbi:MAG TPA: hypothetical protein VLY45_02525 [Nitrospiria bacterium]|nr:hypothetical protein [Nitrospiria bacterium]